MSQCHILGNLAAQRHAKQMDVVDIQCRTKSSRVVRHLRERVGALCRVGSAVPAGVKTQYPVAGKCRHMLVPIAVVSRKAMIQTYGRRTFGTGEFVVDIDVANQDFRHQFNRFAVVVALR